MLDHFGKITQPRITRPFTLGEEIFHSITHGIGSGLSIAGFTLLLVLAILFGDVYQIVSFSIFGASLVLLYLSSTLYHGFQQPRVKHIFKIFDHASIYLLIAGTYTPFLLIGLGGSTGWTFLFIVWGIAQAIGAYSLNHDPRRPLIVLACVGAFLGFWVALLVLFKKRQKQDSTYIEE